MTTLPSVKASAPSVSVPVSVAVLVPADDRRRRLERQVDWVPGQRSDVGGRVDGPDGEVVVLALGEPRHVVGGGGGGPDGERLRRVVDRAVDGGRVLPLVHGVARGVGHGVPAEVSHRGLTCGGEAVDLAGRGGVGGAERDVDVGEGAGEVRDRPRGVAAVDARVEGDAGGHGDVEVTGGRRAVALHDAVRLGAHDGVDVGRAGGQRVDALGLGDRDGGAVVHAERRGRPGQTAGHVHEGDGAAMSRCSAWSPHRRPQAAPRRRDTRCWSRPPSASSCRRT